MSERAEALANQLAQVTAELAAAVEGCSDETWKKTCSAEGWSIGVTAHHAASSYGPVFGLAQAVATGVEVPPITMEMIDAGNAQHAIEYANCTKEDVLAILRTDAPGIIEGVRGLSDEQLDCSAALAMTGGAPMSAQQIVEGILINHPREHLESIRSAQAR